MLAKTAVENSLSLDQALEAENASDEPEIALQLVGNPLANTTLPSLDWQDEMYRWTNHQKRQSTLGGFRFEVRNAHALEEQSRG